MENEIEISDSKKAFEIANLETNLAELRSVIGRACICCAGCPYANMCAEQPRTAEAPSTSIDDSDCNEIFVTDDFFSTAKIINQIENMKIDDTSHSNETFRISEDEIVEKEIIKSQITTKKIIKKAPANISNCEIRNIQKPKSKINSTQRSKIDETIQTATWNRAEIKKPIIERIEEKNTFKVPETNPSKQNSNYFEINKSYFEPPKQEIIIPIHIEAKHPELETTPRFEKPELPKIFASRPNDSSAKIELNSQEKQKPEYSEEITNQEKPEIIEYINEQKFDYTNIKTKTKSKQQIQTTIVERPKNIHNKRLLRITYVTHGNKKQSSLKEFRADLIFAIARLAISKISVSHLDYSSSSRYNNY